MDTLDGSLVALDDASASAGAAGVGATGVGAGAGAGVGAGVGAGAGAAVLSDGPGCGGVSGALAALCSVPPPTKPGASIWPWLPLWMFKPPGFGLFGCV